MDGRQELVAAVSKLGRERGIGFELASQVRAAIDLFEETFPK
jgi:hypothetical protein